jgi:hypothetical protein
VTVSFAAAELLVCPGQLSTSASAYQGLIYFIRAFYPGIHLAKSIYSTIYGQLSEAIINPFLERQFTWLFNSPVAVSPKNKAMMH